MLKNPEQTKNEIVEWIRDYFKKNGPDCDAVVGVSGGKDSSVVAALLAEALGKPVVSVPTVDAIAMNMCFCREAVVPLMDARRNETYTGIYEFDCDGHMNVLHEQCAVPLDEIINDINEYGRPVVFLGDGVKTFRAQLEEKIKVPFSFAPAHMNRQRAGAVGVLAMQYYAEGKYADAAEHRPEYLRVSQAERERAERM